jgi:hypothetical protein
MPKLKLVWTVEIDTGEVTRCGCKFQPCDNLPSHILDSTNPDGIGDLLREQYKFQGKAPKLSLTMHDEHSAEDIIPMLDARTYRVADRAKGKLFSHNPSCYDVDGQLMCDHG